MVWCTGVQFSSLFFWAASPCRRLHRRHVANLCTQFLTVQQRRTPRMKVEETKEVQPLVPWRHCSRMSSDCTNIEGLLRKWCDKRRLLKSAEYPCRAITILKNSLALTITLHVRFSVPCFHLMGAWWPMMRKWPKNSIHIVAMFSLTNMKMTYIPDPVIVHAGENT